MPQEYVLSPKVVLFASNLDVLLLKLQDCLGFRIWGSKLLRLQALCVGLQVLQSGPPQSQWFQFMDPQGKISSKKVDLP